MATEARPRILIVFDDLVDVVSAYVADTKAVRVSTGRADNHVLIEFDATGLVVGVEIQGASALVPDRWKHHPDRGDIPSEIAIELDRWLATHWADLHRLGT